MLLRKIIALIKIIRMFKYLLRFFKANTTLWILSKSHALVFVKVESHCSDSITANEDLAISASYS
jgi:hypothetical protein